jgi:hypothetical protein
MSARATNRWNARPTAIAIAIPYGAAFEVVPMREKLSAMRDTLIVVGMQIAFRAAMLLRRLNY